MPPLKLQTIIMKNVLKMQMKTEKSFFRCASASEANLTQASHICCYQATQSRRLCGRGATEGPMPGAGKESVTSFFFYRDRSHDTH
jgi:hypothetical protein